MESLYGPGDEFMTDVFLQDDLSPTIAEHATQCQSLFHKHMVMPDLVPDPTILDDQLARFALWASNMDVYGPLNVSLDYRLRFSPTAADIIHQLLDIICDTLLSCGYFSYHTYTDRSSRLMESSTTVKPISIHEEPPQSPNSKRRRISEFDIPGVGGRDGDDSDSGTELDPAEENILKITETIGGTLTRLFRLSNAVRKSAKANRARKIERYKDDAEANKAIDELRLYTRCYIEFRFPEAPEALRSALIEANALRLRRLYYQRSHRRRIDLSIQSPKPTPAVVQLPKMTESAPAVRFASNVEPKPATTGKVANPTPVPATNASTARQTAVAALYAKSTTEVPRAKSVLVNNKLSFPPLPPTQQCPYCSVIIEFKNSAKTLLWQNHVIGDLEPFVCVFSHCLKGGQHGHSSDPLTFETSKAWSSHMQTAHGHTWECRAPSHDPIVFEEAIQYQEHSIKEHGVPQAHAGILSNAARRQVPEKVLECPFGDDFQPSEKVTSNAVFASEALESHVAGHMKEIALLTLQKLPGDEEEEEENVDSDQALDDNGPPGVLGITRASMYSVLDDEELDPENDDAEAADGDVAQRELDISQGVAEIEIEDKDDSGMTKLHSAVQAGDLRLVESLIQNGANLNARDQYGRTPLHYAVDRGKWPWVEALMKHGADLSIVDDFGISPFLWTVIAGQQEVAEALLHLDPDLVNSHSPDGKSALAWAASLGQFQVVRALVECHASVVDTRHPRKTLPLEEAAASGQLNVVRFLLDRGADPNHRDLDGWSAIHRAAEEGYLEIVRALIQSGANPRAVSSYGTSPLHCAANGGHVNIVSLLLAVGVNPLKSTCHGWTALHHAVFMGHSTVVRFLLLDDRIRSNASQQDNHGWSVLHLAAHNRDLLLIQTLLNDSVIAEPQILFDESGLTAEEWLDRGPASHAQKTTSNLAFSKSRCCRAVTNLRQAVVLGNIPMIKLLHHYGQHVDGKNSGRRTALYYAAKQRMISIMDILLDMGANPHILPAGLKSWDEFVPHADVLQRLKQAGYRKQDPDLSVERRIREALRAQSQSSAPDHPAGSVPEESTIPPSEHPDSYVPSQAFSSATSSSVRPSAGLAASNKLTCSSTQTSEMTDKKRKVKSGKSRWSK